MTLTTESHPAAAFIILNIISRLERISSVPIDRENAAAYFTEFIERVAEIESNNDPAAKNPYSSAAGLFQFLTGRKLKDGKVADSSFQDAIDRFMVSTKGFTPDWVYAVRTENDPTKISRDKSAAIFLANLDQQVGTDKYFRGIATNGHREDMLALYLRFHHTDPSDAATVARASEIFGV